MEAELRSLPSTKTLVGLGEEAQEALPNYFHGVSYVCPAHPSGHGSCHRQSKLWNQRRPTASHGLRARQRSGCGPSRFTCSGISLSSRPHEQRNPRVSSMLTQRGQRQRNCHVCRAACLMSSARSMDVCSHRGGGTHIALTVRRLQTAKHMFPRSRTQRKRPRLSNAPLRNRKQEAALSDVGHGDLLCGNSHSVLQTPWPNTKPSSTAPKT